MSARPSAEGISISWIGPILRARPLELELLLVRAAVKFDDLRVDLVLMGRNKWHHTLSKAEKKQVKENGKSVVRFQDNITNIPRVTTQYPGVNSRGLAPRRHSQTSNNSWVHAVLFVVLVVIVISWALGY